MRLSQHFTLAEFTFSETAARVGREIEVPPDVLANLTGFCVNVLEPIRIQLARPMFITSGYRPLWLNTAIKGSDTSAHMRGDAADVVVAGMSPQVFTRWIRNHLDHLPLDQVIMEFGRWTHIGTARTPRHEYLAANKINGKTVYTELAA